MLHIVVVYCVVAFWHNIRVSLSVVALWCYVLYMVHTCTCTRVLHNSRCNPNISEHCACVQNSLNKQFLHSKHFLSTNDLNAYRHHRKKLQAECLHV